MALVVGIDEKDYHTFVMTGDGEIEEGKNWEAAMFAAYHKLENLTLIVDYNHQQLDGFLKDILDPAPLREKFDAFGWRTVEIDGHSFDRVIPALEEAPAGRNGKPTSIRANPVQCQGRSFIGTT